MQIFFDILKIKLTNDFKTNISQIQKFINEYFLRIIL